MNTSLAGRHALVCGASSGIGRAAALALAGLGAEITALARRKDRLDSLVAELRETGVTARALEADLDDRATLGGVIDTLLTEVGPVHVLLNNTGGPPGGPLLEATPEAFEVAFGRHVLASHILVGKVLPGMREAGFGRIVNVISTSVREPIPNLGVSNTIRGAMASWSKTLSGELPPGVTINNVLPGFTDTDRLGQLADGAAARQGTTADTVRENWRNMIPEGRLARPEELGDVIAFLASPAASYVRGVSLAVDGGRLKSI
jgi:3-oxoacyl-[acyl-carrier protein] reductase